MTEIDEQVTVPKKQYDEMVEKLADKTQSNTNLVNEIKELREKKQLSEADAEELRKKLEQREVVQPVATELTPEKVAEIASNTLKSALAERESETAKNNRSEAIKKFIDSHKEFHPDNDEGGLKLAALERKLAQFNTAGLKTESEFLSVLDDASKLVSNTQQARPLGSNPNPPAPIGTRAADTFEEDVSKDLTAKEMRLVNDPNGMFNGDKERYLKIKAKRPDYVATLLQYSN